MIVKKTKNILTTPITCAVAVGLTVVMGAADGLKKLSFS